jgi:hypothetical protein
MVEQIQEILDTAERVAEDIRRQAESDANAKLERSRREADLLVSDQLARTRRVVRTLRTQLRDLADEAETIERDFERTVASRSDDRSTVSPRPEVSGRASTGPVAYSGTARTAADAERDSVDVSREAALVRAAQLAVAGEGRATIEASLRTEFGLENPTPLVDEILTGR